MEVHESVKKFGRRSRKSCWENDKKYIHTTLGIITVRQSIQVPPELSSWAEQLHQYCPISTKCTSQCTSFRNSQTNLSWNIINNIKNVSMINFIRFIFCLKFVHVRRFHFAPFLWISSKAMRVFPLTSCFFPSLSVSSLDSDITILWTSSFLESNKRQQMSSSSLYCVSRKLTPSANNNT